MEDQIPDPVGNKSPTQLPVDPTQQDIENNINSLKYDLQELMEKVANSEGKLKIFCADQKELIKNALREVKDVTEKNGKESVNIEDLMAQMVDAAKRAEEISESNSEKAKDIIDKMEKWQIECEKVVRFYQRTRK